MFQPCVDNEMAALVQRHLLPTPDPLPGAIQEAYKHVYRMFRNKSGKAVSWSPDQVLESLHSSQYRKYEYAFDTLKVEPLIRRDFDVKMFVKIEKWPSDTRDRRGKPLAPRAIQYRSTRYTAELSKHLKPIERIVFANHERVDKSPFMKGLDSFKRAERILAMDKWSDTVYVCIDHSKFDAHQTIPWLRAEHAFYRWLNTDPELAELLKVQLVNRCRSSAGIRYVSNGKRMSGEYNTGLGNNVNNLAILHYLCAPMGSYGKDFDFVLDGDDSVIALSRKRLHELGDIPKRCLEVGMSTKLEEVTEDVHELQFCQCRLVYVGSGQPRMVRTPMRAISRGACTVKRLASGEVRRLMSSIGSCELACNYGVPIMQSFALCMIRNAAGAKPLYTKETSFRMGQENVDWQASVKPQPVTEVARASFASAFGYTPGEQVELEAYFDGLDASEWVDALIGRIVRDDAYQEQIPGE